METFSGKVRTILAEAEQRLRHVIAEAAESGDLGGVDVARSATGHLREILRSLDSSDLSHGPHAREDGHKPDATKRAREKKPSNSCYPRFLVRNLTLYRIGWSKKQKEEYEHKVSRDVFDQVIGAMDALSSKNGSGPLASEQIIEQVNHSVEVPIPSYQVYVVIGFLREQHIIQQVGREGYNFSKDLAVQAKRGWESLSLEQKELLRDQT